MIKPDAEVIITEQMESYNNLAELMRGTLAGVVV